MTVIMIRPMYLAEEAEVADEVEVADGRGDQRVQRPPFLKIQPTHLRSLTTEDVVVQPQLLPA